MLPNIEDNITAVVIYLAISISHFPNSFFIGFELVSAHKDTQFYNIITNLHHIYYNFQQKACAVQILFSPLRCLTFRFIEAVDDPPNSRAGFFCILTARSVCLPHREGVVYAYSHTEFRPSWSVNAPTASVNIGVKQRVAELFFNSR